MSDFLVQLAQNPGMRQVLQNLGLPAPPTLQRARGAYLRRPLEGQSVRLHLLGEAPESALSPILSDAGASISQADEERVHALLVDATHMRDTQELAGLFEFMSANIRALRPGGRVLVVGRTPESAPTATAAAAHAGLEGFVRSVAKEIGRTGATASLLSLHDAGADALAGPLRFLLSPHSAYISGQPLTLTAEVSVPGNIGSVRPLIGKIALVTGAARGIGKATAKTLAREGARVVCLDLPGDQERLVDLARELHGHPLAADLTSPETPGLLAETLASMGGVDILVHNAGVTRDKTLARMTRAQWDLVLDINLEAIERVNTSLLQADLLRPHGRVVCLSSVSGIAGNVGQTNYAASKSGLLGYVRHMAGELRDRDIAINAIAPGFIETRMTAAIPAVVREVGRRMNNLSQGGQPRDVAEAITFLSTPGAAGITGQVLRVCGGMMIGA